MRNARKITNNKNNILRITDNFVVFFSTIAAAILTPISTNRSNVKPHFSVPLVVHTFTPRTLLTCFNPSHDYPLSVYGLLLTLAYRPLYPYEYTR